MSVFLRYDAAPFGAGAKILLCPQQPVLAQRPIGELSTGGRLA